MISNGPLSGECSLGFSCGLEGKTALASLNSAPNTLHPTFAIHVIRVTGPTHFVFTFLHNLADAFIQCHSEQCNIMNSPSNSIANPSLPYLVLGISKAFLFL